MKNDSPPSSPSIPEVEKSSVSLTESETEEEEEEVLGTLQTKAQWLHHCIEVQGTTEYVAPSLEDHEKAVDAMVADEGNNIYNRQDVTVHVTVVARDDPFDFDTVHHLPLPRLVEQYPVVLEMVYQEDSSKCFVRVKTDLNVLDGVSALHAGLNLLEYLGTQTMSPYPFTKSNPTPPPEVQFANFQQQLDRVEQGKQEGMANDNSKKEWARTPFMADFEDTFTERPSRRYTSVDVSYRTIMERIDQAKQLLQIPYYAVTVNYSPAVALSLCPTLEHAMDREKRAALIALPPAGTGPPAPMNAAHVEILFNTVFLNSYGKHKPQHLGGAKVVGYTWDWSGMMKSFPPFFHVTQIQDKMFFRMSAAPPDMKLLDESKLFDNIGTFQSFRGLRMYSTSAPKQ